MKKFYLLFLFTGLFLLSFTLSSSVTAYGQMEAIPHLTPLIPNTQNNSSYISNNKNLHYGRRWIDGNQNFPETMKNHRIKRYYGKIVTKKKKIEKDSPFVRAIKKAALRGRTEVFKKRKKHCQKKNFKEKFSRIGRKHHKKKKRMEMKCHHFKNRNRKEKIVEKLYKDFSHTLKREGKGYINYYASLLKSAIYYERNDINHAMKELKKLPEISKKNNDLKKKNKLNKKIRKIKHKLLVVNEKLASLNTRKDFLERCLEKLLEIKKNLSNKKYDTIIKKLEKERRNILLELKCSKMKIQFLKNEMKYFVKDRDKRKTRREIFNLQIKVAKYSSKLEEIEIEIGEISREADEKVVEDLLSEKSKIEDRIETLKDDFNVNQSNNVKEMNILNKELKNLEFEINRNRH